MTDKEYENIKVGMLIMAYQTFTYFTKTIIQGDIFRVNSIGYSYVSVSPLYEGCDGFPNYNFYKYDMCINFKLYKREENLNILLK